MRLAADLGDDDATSKSHLLFSGWLPELDPGLDLPLGATNHTDVVSDIVSVAGVGEAAGDGGGVVAEGVGEADEGSAVTGRAGLAF
jgi:hypothetical protein